MPTADYVQRSLSGAWRMMLGRAEGLRLLDLSVDGFWTSFHAITLALPALFLNWLSVAARPEFADHGLTRSGVIMRLAIVDILVWVVPIFVIVLLARPLGLAGRIVPLVVATNWGSGLLTWLLLPPVALRLLIPSLGDAATLISVALFGVSLVLTWRLINVALGMGAAVSAAVFGGLFVGSVVLLTALQSLVGLTPPL